MSAYCNKGIEALLRDGGKVGNNRKMRREEAQAFLSRFDRKAQDGQTVTVKETALAYDEVTQKRL